MEDSIDIKQLFSVLKNHLVPIAVSAVICGAAGFSAAIALKNPEMPVADSIAHAKELLARAAYTYLQAQK